MYYLLLILQLAKDNLNFSHCEFYHSLFKSCCAVNAAVIHFYTLGISWFLEIVKFDQNHFSIFFVWVKFMSFGPIVTIVIIIANEHTFYIYYTDLLYVHKVR